MDKHGHNPKVGLLGGSFNPAHEGHLEISMLALKLLDLDQIWWLVSPGNPLKDLNDLAPYNERFKTAQKIVTDPRIKVSDIEKKMNTRYTIDTLMNLVKKYTDYHFVWLMGADNLSQLDKWKDWKKIVEIVPFAIFNRPSYSKQSLGSTAATYLKEYKIDPVNAHELYALKPPAWIYFDNINNPMSSTEIRNKNE